MIFIRKLIGCWLFSQGAYITRKWSDDCTHVLVEDYSPLANEIIDAMLARKEIVSIDWFKVLLLVFENTFCILEGSCFIQY